MTQVSKLYRVSAIARRLGIPQQTLHSAITRGEIRCEITACGLPLVRAEAVEQYLANRPRPGRKAQP